MMFLIYCPCKVKQIGLELIRAATFPRSKVFHYMLYLDIANKVDPGCLGRSRCKLCDGFLRIVGHHRPADSAAGVTSEMIKRAFTLLSRRPRTMSPCRGGVGVR